MSTGAASAGRGAAIGAGGGTLHKNFVEEMGGDWVQSAMKKLIEEPNESDLPEEIKAILAKNKAGRKKFRRNLLIFMIFVMLVYFLGMFSLFLSGHFLHSILFLLALVAGEIFGIRLLKANWKKAGYEIDESEIECLNSIEDKRVLGVLLDFNFSYLSKERGEKVKSLLAKRLRSLTLEDGNLLTQKQKRRLVSLVYTSKDDLIIAIFGYLEQIGDTNQLSSLKLWRQNRLSIRVKPEVLAAYKSCVAAIEARAAATRTDAQLLRPSSSLDSAETLLRPHTHKADEDAETLLRAGHGKDEDAEK